MCSDLSHLTAGSRHHGMHISSDSRGNCPSISSALPEYDIWRSWEDCLWFQQTLEDEYEQAAREKRRRLAQGKGVKGFNGLYKKDLASSWDSLPSGPDHRSVAQDIHEHLPALTKRGTLFRASQVTINRRQAELIAFIRTLFSDDMPALIKEIRVSRLVSDFFGLWKSDLDFSEGSQTLTVPRASFTNSTRAYSKSHRSTTSRPFSPSSSTEILGEPIYPGRSSHRSRYRPPSTSSGSSACSESSSDTSSSSSSSPAIAGGVPIVFGHNRSDQFKSILEELPEKQETLPKPIEPCLEGIRRPRASATERKANRSYSIFGPSSNEGSVLSESLGIVLFIFSFLSHWYVVYFRWSLHQRILANRQLSGLNSKRFSWRTGACHAASNQGAEIPILDC